MTGNETTAGGINEPCGLCSNQYSKVWHTGQCPRIKAIEYYPDGTVKRIEYREWPDE